MTDAATSFFFAASVVLGGWLGEVMVLNRFRERLTGWLNQPSSRDPEQTTAYYASPDVQVVPIMDKLAKEFETATAFAAVLSLVVSLLFNAGQNDYELASTSLLVALAILPFAIFVGMFVCSYEKYKKFATIARVPTFVAAQFTVNVAVGVLVAFFQ